MGKDGVTQAWLPGVARGVVRVLGEDWDCVSTGYIGPDARVKVESVDGILLMVVAAG
ncbi:MAG: NfeD family protein [Terriglobia bacterium]